MGVGNYRKLSMISSSAALPGRVLDSGSDERLVHDAEQLHEVLLVGLDVDDARGELASGRVLVQQPQGAHLVGRVIVLSEFAEQDLRAVVQGHRRRGAGIVLDGDVLEERDEAHVAERFVVILREA